MLPLKDYFKYNRGYVFKEKTWYSKYHLGVDIICPTGTPVLAPFKGKAIQNGFLTGGKVIDFYFEQNGQKYVARFMHLSAYQNNGDVKESDIIALSGNSGTLTTGAHVHLDLSRNKVNIKDINNFLDPDKFNWVTSEEERPKPMYSNGVQIEFIKEGDIKSNAGDTWPNVAPSAKVFIKTRGIILDKTADLRWYKMRLVDGREGWMRAEFLKAIPNDSSGFICNLTEAEKQKVKELVNKL